MKSGKESPPAAPNRQPASPKKVYLCDRCGSRMVEKNCKVTCPNCGNRFDCSDLNIHFD
jgi:rubrerythrin